MNYIFLNAFTLGAAYNVDMKPLRLSAGVRHRSTAQIARSISSMEISNGFPGMCKVVHR